MRDSEIKELEEKARFTEALAPIFREHDKGYAKLANPTAILSLIERLRECESVLSKYAHSHPDYFKKWGT